MIHSTDTLAVIRGLSDGLIRSELLSMEQRAKLEQAARDAVLKLGIGIDEVSEASGLTPADIHRAIEDSSHLDSDVAALAGMR